MRWTIPDPGQNRCTKLKIVVFHDIKHQTTPRATIRPDLGKIELSSGCISVWNHGCFRRHSTKLWQQQPLSTGHLKMPFTVLKHISHTTQVQ